MPAGSIYQLTEVLVLGEKDPSLTDRKIDDRLVFGPRGDFSHGHNIVRGGAEGTDSREVATLIGQEAHPSALCALAGGR